MRNKFASDPGLYNPNYDAIYKRSVFPIIRRANMQSNVQTIQEANTIVCSRSRNIHSIYNSNIKPKFQQNKSNSMLNKSSTQRHFTNKHHINPNQKLKRSRINAENNPRINQSYHTERGDLFALFKNNIKETYFNKSPSSSFNNNDLNTKRSTIDFEKMTGRHDKDHFSFKQKLEPSASYTPNYLFNDSHVKSILYS